MAQSLGWFEEYRWSFTFSAFLLGLGYHGPAIIGINWHNDMYEPDAGGFVRPTGGIAGGHAILANGVNLRDRSITLHNSWGKSWGIQGECKVRWSDMEDLLADDGEVVFFVDRATRR